MTRFSPWIVALAIYFLIFAESHFNGCFRWLGVKVDLVPCVIVYCAFRWGLIALAGLSVWAGLCFDALSGNPNGTTILPLLIVGYLMQQNRENLLHTAALAQAVLGFAACVAVPGLSLIEMATLGFEPIIGGWTVWQFVMMGISGALATPLIFRGLERIGKALSYQVAPEIPFRTDREIKRGKA